PAAVFGFLVLHQREPLGGELWSAFVATLVAFVPPLVLLGRWRERALVTSGMRAREAEARTTIRDRELEAVSAVSTALAQTHDAEAAARLLLQHVVDLFGVEFTALALVNEETSEAVGFLALSAEGEADWWRDVRLDLANEPSGIASAVFEAAPVAIYDVEESSRVSARLAEAVGAKSGVWVPLISEERVLGVLVAVTTGERRAFTSEEITLMQALAGGGVGRGGRGGAGGVEAGGAAAGAGRRRGPGRGAGARRPGPRGRAGPARAGRARGPGAGEPVGDGRDRRREHRADADCRLR